jgi:hypothetical protein
MENSQGIIYQGYLLFNHADINDNKNLQKVYAILNADQLVCYSENPSLQHLSKINVVSKFSLYKAKMSETADSNRPKSFSISTYDGSIAEFVCATNSVKFQWVKQLQVQLCADNVQTNNENKSIVQTVNEIPDRSRLIKPPTETAQRPVQQDFQQNDPQDQPPRRQNTVAEPASPRPTLAAARASAAKILTPVPRISYNTSLLDQQQTALGSSGRTGTMSTSNGMQPLFDSFEYVLFYFILFYFIWGRYLCFCFCCTVVHVKKDAREAGAASTAAVNPQWIPGNFGNNQHSSRALSPSAVVSPTRALSSSRLSAAPTSTIAPAAAVAVGAGKMARRATEGAVRAGPSSDITGSLSGSRGGEMFDTSIGGTRSSDSNNKYGSANTGNKTGAAAAKTGGNVPRLSRQQILKQQNVFHVSQPDQDDEDYNSDAFGNHFRSREDAAAAATDWGEEGPGTPASNNNSNRNSERSPSELQASRRRSTGGGGGGVRTTADVARRSSMPGKVTTSGMKSGVAARRDGAMQAQQPAASSRGPRSQRPKARDAYGTGDSSEEPEEQGEQVGGESEQRIYRRRSGNHNQEEEERDDASNDVSNELEKEQERQQEQDQEQEEDSAASPTTQLLSKSMNTMTVAEIRAALMAMPAMVRDSLVAPAQHPPQRHKQQKQQQQQQQQWNEDTALQTPHNTLSFLPEEEEAYRESSSNNNRSYSHGGASDTRNSSGIQEEFYQERVHPKAKHGPFVAGRYPAVGEFYSSSAAADDDDNDAEADRQGSSSALPSRSSQHQGGT